MTRLNYFGSVLIAFALGGVGVWALQGHYKPLLNHLLAVIEARHVEATPQAVTPSVTAQPLAQSAPQSQTGSSTVPVPQGTGAMPLQTPSNPFQEMERMQKQMDQFFNHNGFFQNGFFGGNSGTNSIFGHNGLSSQGGMFGSGGMFGNMGSLFSNQSGATITQGQDDKSVYYKLQLGNKQDLSNVKVNVDHGYVSINAKLQNKSSNSYSASTVSEQFPVPAGVDPNSAKITKQGDAIVIRFNKVQA